MYNENSGKQGPLALVVEDHPLIAEFFAELIAEIAPLSHTAITSTIEAAIAQIKGQQIDLLILDINLADGMSISWVEVIRQIRPDIRILMVSSLPEETFGPRSIQLGADGYINKRASVDMITNAIKTVLAGNKYISPALLETLLDVVKPGGGMQTPSSSYPAGNLK